MSQSHDGSYKLLFSHPEMVESLIRDFVPEDWVRDLDFATLERQNGSYVTDDLRERHDDVIWRIKSRTSWFYIYLLIEFQSAIDPWMALRIMTYTGLLYQDLVKSGQITAADPLPPVFPLVLYNGQSAWTARLEIAELIAPMPATLAKYRPSMRYFLLDEGRIPTDDLDKDSLVAHLMRMERSEGPEGLRAILADLRVKLGERRYQPLRRAFTVWIRRVLLNRLMPQETLPDLNDLKEVEAMLAERVTEWTEKWKQEGLREGRAEGRIEGEAKGRSAILNRLLAKRFGQDILDIRVQERLRTATPEQLDLWAERILDAASIDDVFAE
jgi:predicted transposase YdaD